MNIIYTGHLNIDHKQYNVKQLTMDHIEEIITLQHTVYQQLENKGTLEKLSRDEFRNILEGNGLMTGAFVDQELIAIRALLIPPIDEHHLGKFVGLSEADLEKVIYQEITFVHPNFRGNRLQQRLADLIMQELEKSRPDFQYVCCTVAPFNIPSLLDKFKQKMKVKALEQVYGEKLRYVFVKDLRAEGKMEWTESKKVPMSDISSQQEMLASGWEGTQLINENAQYYVLYVKVINS